MLIKVWTKRRNAGGKDVVDDVRSHLCIPLGCPYVRSSSNRPANHHDDDVFCFCCSRPHRHDSTASHTMALAETGGPPVQDCNAIGANVFRSGSACSCPLLVLNRFSFWRVSQSESEPQGELRGLSKRVNGWIDCKITVWLIFNLRKVWLLGQGAMTCWNAFCL